MITDNKSDYTPVVSVGMNSIAPAYRLTHLSLTMLPIRSIHTLSLCTLLTAVFSHSSGHAQAATVVPPEDAHTETASPFFAKAEHVDGDWWRLQRVGSVNLSRVPWIWHARHGWLYIRDLDLDPGTAFAWNAPLGWLWLDTATYPWIHNAELGWLYAFEGAPDTDRFFRSTELDILVQVRGDHVVPARGDVLPQVESNNDQLAITALPEELLERPITPAEWTAAGSALQTNEWPALLENLGQVAAQNSAIQDTFEALQKYADLIGISGSDLRSEADIRSAQNTVAAALSVSLRRIATALRAYRQSDAIRGEIVEAVQPTHTIVRPLDLRLTVQSERFMAETISPLEERITRLIERVSALAWDSFYEGMPSSFEDDRPSASVVNALEHRITQTHAAQAFAAAHSQSLEALGVIAQAFTAGQITTDDDREIPLDLTAALNASIAQTNALAREYWRLQDRAADGSPGGSYNYSGSITIHGGFDLGSWFNLIGGYSPSPAYVEHLEQIQAAAEAALTAIETLTPLDMPLLSPAAESTLQTHAANLSELNLRLEALDTILQTTAPDPTPEDFYPTDLETSGVLDLGREFQHPRR